MQVPFTFGKIATGENFTDREEETMRLENNFNYCVNTILISPRRWGKSSLVHKAAAKAMMKNPNLRVCHIDLLNILTVEDFYIQYATAIIKATSTKWEEFIKNAKEFLASLMPKVSITPIPGEEVSLSLDIEQLRMNLDEILDLPEKIATKKGITVSVCIDEFQKIGEWRDSDYLQGKFRSKWQHHQHVGYCLFGSKRHRMMEIFTDSSKPFYRFGDLIFLNKVPKNDMQRFVKERFNETGKHISDEAAFLLIELVDNHPYYCQQLAQISWFRTDTECDPNTVREAHKSLVEQLSLLFINLTEELNGQQLSYLKALLNNETSITATETMKRYGITSATSATRAKASLIKRDILDNAEGKIQFLDPVYQYWLRHSFFKINSQGDYPTGDNH